MFLGDGPACQFEAGHQKGGHFPCWFCNAKATRWDDLTYMLNANITPFDHKRTDVLRTPKARTAAVEGKSNYFEDMEQHELIAELIERKVSILYLYILTPRFLDYVLIRLHRLISLLT